ncbi:TonB-dependent receptor plug domain-containing protein [Massilia sp. Se16.2.3]|uniref:TonB-dependent receptor plug domain-containing protein n=1 Tax=Massilia sp. Se16.2.3 TaxID=2709303 RepID=UPI0035A6ADCE
MPCAVLGALFLSGAALAQEAPASAVAPVAPQNRTPVCAAAASSGPGQATTTECAAAATPAATAANPAPAAPVSTAATPAQPRGSPDGQPVNTVSVTAQRSGNRTDRQVYDVKADPATVSDTVADTLNKVPSVAVDADGAVTLRGKTNVQIYVDGKPSAMMQGENRAMAISSMPAGDLDSVEVINNPGAQFGNEGGGGPIINLVMRRERRPGGFGSVTAIAGSGGRAGVNAAGSYTTGRMSIQGGGYIRKEERHGTGETRRERIDPLTGARVHTAARTPPATRASRRPACRAWSATTWATRMCWPPAPTSCRNRPRASRASATSAPIRPAWSTATICVPGRATGATAITASAHASTTRATRPTKS